MLFYNFDAEGEVDPAAVHAACEVEAGVKWAANHWFNIPEHQIPAGTAPDKDQREL